MARGRNPLSKFSRKANPRAIENVNTRVAIVHGFNRSFDIGQKVALPITEELIKNVRENWDDTGNEVADLMSLILEKSESKTVHGEVTDILEHLNFTPDEYDVLLEVVIPALGDEKITMEGSWFDISQEHSS